MRVILQITSGPSEGRRIPLQVGEIARFGRSDAADVCFAGDHEMSDVHFEIECLTDRCLIRDMQSAAGTLLNDESVPEAALSAGDVIRAGGTRLLAHVEGMSHTENPVGADDSPSPTEDDSATQPRTAAELCEILDLEDESQALLLPEHTPESFVTTLVEHQQFSDAIRVLAMILPKREAIWWAYLSVGDLSARTLSADEEAARNSALTWLKDPSDKNRRATMAAAQLTEFHHGAAWVAASAFWSEGSLTPPDLPDVAPDELLTGQGVSAALVLTATQGDPAKATEKYQQMLQTGQEILGGSHPLPA